MPTRMPPEITELSALTPHNEESWRSANGIPPLAGGASRFPESQLGQGGAQPFANDSAMAQPDFVDSRMACGTRWSAQSVDEENAHAGHSQKCLARPLLHQLWRNHGEGGEGVALAVHVDGTEGDERFAGPALRDDRCASRLVPTLHHTHDRERLCRERLPEKMRDERRRCIVKAVQWRIRLKNSLAQLWRPGTQIGGDRVDVLR